eukprot:8140897-Pyramimonas_sp.AAC.1
MHRCSESLFRFERIGAARMQRKRYAGRARQCMPPGQARATAPPCEPRSRAGRAPVENGSSGK